MLLVLVFGLLSRMSWDAGSSFAKGSLRARIEGVGDEYAKKARRPKQTASKNAHQRRRQRRVFFTSSSSSESTPAANEKELDGESESENQSSDTSIDGASSGEEMPGHWRKKLERRIERMRTTLHRGGTPSPVSKEKNREGGKRAKSRGEKRQSPPEKGTRKGKERACTQCQCIKGMYTEAEPQNDDKPVSNLKNDSGLPCCHLCHLSDEKPANSGQSSKSKTAATVEENSNIKCKSEGSPTASKQDEFETRLREVEEQLVLSRNRQRGGDRDYSNLPTSATSKPALRSSATVSTASHSYQPSRRSTPVRVSFKNESKDEQSSKVEQQCRSKDTITTTFPSEKPVRDGLSPKMQSTAATSSEAEGPQPYSTSPEPKGVEVSASTAVPSESDTNDKQAGPSRSVSAGSTQELTDGKKVDEPLPASSMSNTKKSENMGKYEEANALPELSTQDTIPSTLVSGESAADVDGSGEIFSEPPEPMPDVESCEDTSAPLTNKDKEEESTIEGQASTTSLTSLVVGRGVTKDKERKCQHSDENAASRLDIEMKLNVVESREDDKSQRKTNDFEKIVPETDKLDTFASSTGHAPTQSDMQEIIATSKRGSEAKETEEDKFDSRTESSGSEDGPANAKLSMADNEEKHRQTKSEFARKIAKIVFEDVVALIGRDTASNSKSEELQTKRPAETSENEKGKNFAEEKASADKMDTQDSAIQVKGKGREKGKEIHIEEEATEGDFSQTANNTHIQTDEDKNIDIETKSAETTATVEVILEKKADKIVEVEKEDVSVQSDYITATTVEEQNVPKGTRNVETDTSDAAKAARRARDVYVETALYLASEYPSLVEVSARHVNKSLDDDFTRGVAEVRQSKVGDRYARLSNIRG